MLYNLFIYKCLQNSSLSISLDMFFLLTLTDQLLREMRASRKCQLCKQLTAKFAYSCCYVQSNKRMQTCHRCLQKNIIRNITLAVLDLNKDPTKAVTCPLCKTKDIMIVNPQGQYRDIDVMVQVNQVTEAANVANLHLEETVEKMNIRQLNQTHALFTRVLRPLNEILHVTDESLF